MKVFYVGWRWDGCYYVRCLQPLIYNGWRWTRNSLYGRTATAEEAVQSAMDSDVVVFQRPDDPTKLEAAKLFIQAWKLVIFENDDTYHVDCEHKFEKALKEKIWVLDNFIKSCHWVTTTTSVLADEYKKINKNVFIIPNYVDPDDWPEPLKNDTDKVRIWLVGSVTTNWDFHWAEDALRKLSDNPNVQLVMFWLPPTWTDPKIQELYKEDIWFWRTLNIEWQPLVQMEDYIDTLNKLRLDIMMIPRKDDYFNRCKSNLKFLEAAMLNIPCVCQSFSDWLSPYDGVVDNNINWILILDNNDWYSRVIELVDDKDKRVKMWEEAHRFVIDNFNIQDHYWEWAEAYSEIAKINWINLK